MLRKRKLKTKASKTTSFAGIYDDDDQEIHLGMQLKHESGWVVEVIRLSHGEITGRVLNFCCANGVDDILYSLNNGKEFTIIKKHNKEDEENN